jgi:EAL and modified HD-GYP domain-containing signal transduction protein
VRDSPDEAFLVGILSLLDTIYAVEMQDLVGDLQLSEHAESALLRREGPFGELLCFVEQMERLEVDEALGQVLALQ